MARPATPLARRLMGKFTAGPGCWIWHASLNDAGYGQISRPGGGAPLRAHRVMYELLVGPIPEGLTIDHLCRNRACVNPSHMEAVTRGENTRRGGGAAAIAAKNLAKTHCLNGHERNEANTYVRTFPDGRISRRCRVCRRRG